MQLLKLLLSDFCLFFGLYAVLSVLYRYVMMPLELLRTLIQICNQRALFMWHNIYLVVDHKPNFRVILIEYEDYKIKYELFCVYCERFSGVRHLIKNHILTNEIVFSIILSQVLGFNYTIAGDPNQLSARLLCHPGDSASDAAILQDFLGLFFAHFFLWSDSCGTMAFEVHSLCDSFSENMVNFSAFLLN